MSQIDPRVDQEGLPLPADAPRPGATHTVTDAYVARRMEEHAAAVAAEEQRETGSATGAEPQSALAFYVLLGFVLSVLLLIVILRTSGPTSEPPPGPQRALTSPG